MNKNLTIVKYSLNMYYILRWRVFKDLKYVSESGFLWIIPLKAHGMNNQ